MFVDDEGHEVKISAATATGPRLDAGRARRQAGRRHHPPPRPGQLRHRPDRRHRRLLQLENERLRADLRARLDELHASRARIVEVSDAERRRLERNLHDGAQQQLVALALQLRMARAKTDRRGEREADRRRTGAARPGALGAARAGPRHPPGDPLRPRPGCRREGRSPSASRCPTEVVFEIAAPARPTVEATAYFVVAEGLANIAKHADAELAKVESCASARSQLEVEVADDGSGGADASKGTGLRGLEERLNALDGSSRSRVEKGAGRACWRGSRSPKPAPPAGETLGRKE